MFRTAIAVLAISVVAAPYAPGAAAQGFVTVRPTPTGIAWWLRAEFHALHTQIRDIPVANIRADWCKATEFRRELFPKGLLVENGDDLLAPAKLHFSLDGNFDGTGKKQTALVGVYETCASRKGRFLLIIDQGTRKMRFLHTDVSEEQFSAIGRAGTDIMVVDCLECDVGAVVKWDRARKRFVMR